MLGRPAYLLIFLMSSLRLELWTLVGYTTLSQITPNLFLCDAQQYSPHPCLSLLGDPFRFTHHNPAFISPLPHSCHIPRLPHPLWCGHPNDIWFGVQIIKLLLIQSSPVSCYVTPVRPLYLSQQFCYMPYTGCYKSIGSKNENNKTKRRRSERSHILITKYRHLGVQITTSIILRSLKSAVVPLLILKIKEKTEGKETLNCSSDAGPAEGQAKPDPYRSSGTRWASERRSQPEASFHTGRRVYPLCI